MYGLIAGIVAIVAVVVITLYLVTGFGQQDRGALARKTVQTYWGDLHRGHTRAAYNLLSSGTQYARPFNQYNQDMFGFLTQTGGVSARVGKPQVHGDRALAPVALLFVQANRPLNGYQHLFWEDGSWRIVDQNGGITQTK